jgi:hypothetical protein
MLKCDLKKKKRQGAGETWGLEFKKKSAISCHETIDNIPNCSKTHFLTYNQRELNKMLSQLTRL